MSDADAARTTRPMLRIDRARRAQSIEALGRIGATPRGGLTRVALTDEDKRGRDAVDLAGYSGGGRASPVT